jgi:hypothetical protein
MSKNKNKAASQLAKARWRNTTPEERAAAASLAARARWANHTPSETPSARSQRKRRAK